eukprot:14800114-Ditylum_brightwellii.AAC.1
MEIDSTSNSNSDVVAGAASSVQNDQSYNKGERKRQEYQNASLSSSSPELPSASLHNTTTTA